MEKAHNGRSALFTEIFFNLFTDFYLSLLLFLLLFLLLHTTGIPFFWELPHSFIISSTATEEYY